MTITIRTGDITIERLVGPITVGLGRKFVLTLGQVRPGTGIRWTTENDPVLDLRESADKLSAKVKATELGVSFVYIQVSGEVPVRLKVTVIPMNDTTNEAVTLNGSIGEQSPDN